MKSAILSVFLLFVIWLIFSTETDSFYLIAGLISSIAAYNIALCLNMDASNKVGISVRFFFYCFWLLKEIAISSLNVTKIIWSPKMNFAPGMKYIDTKLKSRAKKTLYASSITLTPGTITVDIKSDSLLVHALNKSDLVIIAEEAMEKRIKEI